MYCFYFCLRACERFLIQVVYPPFIRGLNCFMMRVNILLLGVFIVLCGFILSLSRLLNCLIVVENFKVLLLFFALVQQRSERHILFIALMVIFTVEVVLGLVVLTRLWDLRSLMGLVG